MRFNKLLTIGMFFTFLYDALVSRQLGIRAAAADRLPRLDPDLRLGSLLCGEFERELVVVSDGANYRAFDETLL